MSLNKCKAKTLKARFWKKVDRNGPVLAHVSHLGRCWIWIANRLKDGYGTIGTATGIEKAHRVSWKLHRGPIGKGMNILHKCDNPPCVRPGHLFQGTPLENNRDREKKGRGKQPKGEAASKCEAHRKRKSSIFERWEEPCVALKFLGGSGWHTKISTRFSVVRHGVISKAALVSNEQIYTPTNTEACCRTESSPHRI